MRRNVLIYLITSIAALPLLASEPAICLTVCQQVARRWLLLHLCRGRLESGWRNGQRRSAELRIDDLCWPEEHDLCGRRPG
jgi:hypothetical protein